MKKFRYLYMTVVAAALTLTSCDYSEDDLTPSNTLTSYQLPQGNHEYDATIQQFYNSNGVYLLYKFSDKDAYWTPTGWQNGEVTTDSVEGKNGFIVVPSKDNNVGRQIALLDELWFSKLDERAKKMLLPRKILLCSEVNKIASKYVFAPTFHMEYYPSPIGAKYNYDNICVAYGSEAINSITDVEKTDFQTALLAEWATYIAERKALTSVEFASSVNYSDKTVSNAYSPMDCTAVGILASGYDSNADKDWLKFIYMMLNFSETYLTEDPGDVTLWTSWNGYDANWNSFYNYAVNYHGILNPAKDVNGILKKRYDIVRQYFINNFVTDLQLIGNNK